MTLRQSRVDCSAVGVDADVGSGVASVEVPPDELELDLSVVDIGTPLKAIEDKALVKILPPGGVKYVHTNRNISLPWQFPWCGYLRSSFGSKDFAVILRCLAEEEAGPSAYPDEPPAVRLRRGFARHNSMVEKLTGLRAEDAVSWINGHTPARGYPYQFYLF